MENQAYLFFIFILNGFLVGIFFDIFRILRRSFNTSDFITYVEDILFWILTGFSVLYCIFKFNDGELRGFIFIGIFIGVSIYLLIFSKAFITINLYIIGIIKKIVYNIVIIPIKFILKLFKKIIFKPSCFIIINFKKSLSYLIIKSKKNHNKNKKSEYKKDFT